LEDTDPHKLNLEVLLLLVPQTDTVKALCLPLPPAGFSSSIKISGRLQDVSGSEIGQEEVFAQGWEP
jgi:hypothetical protein